MFAQTITGLSYRAACFGTAIAELISRDGRDLPVRRKTAPDRLAVIISSVRSTTVLLLRLNYLVLQCNSHALTGNGACSERCELLRCVAGEWFRVGSDVHGDLTGEHLAAYVGTLGACPQFASTIGKLRRATGRVTVGAK
jgi:hypothetical protein